jgi:hypothetical protein
MRTQTPFAIVAALVAIAGLQIVAAGVDFRTILHQLGKVLPKQVVRTAPTPEVELYPVPVGKPGQRLDLSIPGKDFAKDATVYFPSPFVDHISQKVVSSTRLSATIALAADAWPGFVTGVVVNPSTGRKTQFDGLRVPGRLELDLKAENGLRIRFTELPSEPDAPESTFVAEFFKAGSPTPFVKGVGSLNRIFEDEMGVSAAISSEDPDKIPPCGGFYLDTPSIAPGRPTFTGKAQCDSEDGMSQIELKMTGTARRLM